MSIEINDLESKRFGIVAARLTDPEAPLEDVDREAAAAGVDMMTARVSVGDLSRAHALEASGYRLMDTLVYYTHKLDTLSAGRPLAPGVTLRTARPEDAPRAADLARMGFEGYFGHYHADPMLDNAAADAAYVEWAETSLATVSEQAPVLLAELDERIVGFLTIRRNSAAEMELILSAVDPSCQGKGLYGALIAGSLPLSKDAGVERVLTSTQINNYAVQRVWTRLGFMHSSSLYTFHKWYVK